MSELSNAESTEPRLAPAPPPDADPYQRLRRAILDGELGPGQRLSNASLAVTYGVPRGQLRESLALLTHEGLLELGPDRRLRVAPIEVGELDELYGARISLETLGVSITVPRLTETEHYELERRLSEMQACARERDVCAWNRAHRSFHELLVARTGGRLADTIRNLRELSGRYRRRLLAEPRAWSIGTSEHAAIAAACHQGDAELARELLARHLARTALTLVTQIAPGYEPVAVREALRTFSTRTPPDERTTK